MPIHEFKCEDCDAVTEVWMQSPAERLVACLKCGSKNIHQIISKTSFQLKGGCWAKDNYGKMEKETKACGDCIDCQWEGAKGEGE